MGAATKFSSHTGACWMFLTEFLHLFPSKGFSGDYRNELESLQPCFVDFEQNNLRLTNSWLLFFFFKRAVPLTFWQPVTLSLRHSQTKQEIPKSNQKKRKNSQQAVRSGSLLGFVEGQVRVAVNMGYVPVHVSYFYSLLISNKAP